MERTILHSDMNNFFASVECHFNGSLAGVPVAVAGNPDSRHGIVLAKNELAKACGVKTGEALWQAKQKCADIVFVEPHYERYLEFSRAAREIYGQYTDLVESFGMDECWLDVTGSGKLFGDGRKIADEIRDKIRSRLGVTASVGVSFNKVFAKLGSDMKKPDATTIIDREHFRERVWPLPAGDMLYVGPSTAEKLSRFGINTIGELATADEQLLGCLFGKSGTALLRAARGEESAPVSAADVRIPPKSISCGRTAVHDIHSEEEAKVLLCALSAEVSRRLREQQLLCRCVCLNMRDSLLSSFERRIRVSPPGRTCADIFAAALELYRKNAAGSVIRAMSVAACELVCRESEQLSFAPEIARRQKIEQLESTADELNRRLGGNTVFRGVLLSRPELADIGIETHPFGMNIP